MLREELRGASFGPRLEAVAEVEEADVTKGLISTSSPIGKALLGKKPGDEVTVVTPAGTREYEVVRLFTIYDEE